MKTITELQAQLRETAARLELLSGDIAALQKSQKKQGLDFQHIETVGRRYPFATHCMKDQSKELQKRYFALLGALLLLDCKDPENGWLFVQRLLTTTGCTASLMDLQVSAATLTIEQLDQTTKEVIAKELQNAMLLDLMLLYLACAGKAAGQEYIAAIAELLGAQPQRVQELAQLAGLVAKKDAEKLQEFLKEKFLKEKDGLFWVPMAGQIVQVVPCVAYQQGDSLYVYGDGKTPVSEKARNAIQFSNQIRNIKVYDAVFTESPVRFENGESLLLDGCKIQNIRISGVKAFQCNHISKVKIKKCYFDSLKSRNNTIYFDDISNLTIEDVTIHNVVGTASVSYAWYFGSGAFGTLKNVTAKQMKGNYWFYNKGSSQITAENCFYSECSRKASGLPAGFIEKEDL